MTENAAADAENTLYLELKDGRVVIQLRPDLAPLHVARIKELARKGFYDGVVFHRVIDGFMAQGGDPTGTGTGGSDLPDLPAEFSSPAEQRQQPVLHHVRPDAEPGRPVHHLGPGRVGHGGRGQDQARCRPVRHGAGTGQDHLHEGRGRRRRGLTPAFR